MSPEDGARRSTSPEDEPRRFLLTAAITRYPKAPAQLGWDRPGLADARERIVEMFTRRLGYRHCEVLGLNPTQDQLTRQIRQFCRSPERRPDDLIALYIAGHGEILDQGGGHVLLTSDTDPEDIEDALPTQTLARKLLLGTPVRRLLLLLDTCYSGRGGNELAAAALAQLDPQWGAEPGSGFVIVSSAQPHEQADTGAFPRLLELAVTSLATAGHGPRTLSVGSVVQQMNDHPERPRHQTIGWDQFGLTGEPPPFLPNPRHDARLTEVDLAIQQAAAWEEQAGRRDTEFRTRMLLRAMGSTDPDRMGWWFSGRHQALTDITRWLAAAPPPESTSASSGGLAVTAGPGSGKTAVLGLIATWNHPERRRTIPLAGLGLSPRILPEPGAVDAVSYVQNLSDEQVLEGIAAAAGVPARTVGEFLEGLAGRGTPFTVLLDALDEAATPDTLCSRILRPLIDHADGRIRLLLGTRPHLLPRLGLAREQQIDLDAEHYADPEALLAYTVRNLVEAHPDSPYPRCPAGQRLGIAREVAAAAGLSFLVARITAGTLAASAELPDPQDRAWRAGLPRLPGEAMRADLAQRLGADAGRAADLLRPLAFAEGQGLPWEDLWAPLASALSGRDYTDDDLLWLRATAGTYVVEATEADHSAYRLYHQALAEHLREGVDERAVHAHFTRTLLRRVPLGPDGVRDWARAHPYVQRHLATHAAFGGLLDELVVESEYLVHAEPESLMAQLHMVRSSAARLSSAVYRASVGAHRDTGPAERRRILALDAARYNARALLDAFNAKTPDGVWRPTRASGGTLSLALRNTLAGHGGSVQAVACTVLEGRPVTLVGASDPTVRMWDIATGRLLGQALTGHTRSVNAVACTELDGWPIAVTGSDDRTVRVWDLTTGNPIGQPLIGHSDDVNAVACTELDGRPIAVTGSDDRTVRVWDLTTGKPIGQPLTGHTYIVWAVTCTELNGRPIAVTGGHDGTIRIWDLATGTALGDPLVGRAGEVYALACTELDGRTIAVACHWEEKALVWDLTTRQLIGPPLTGYPGVVRAVACTRFDGRLIAVTGAEEHPVRLWDLSTAQPFGQLLKGHTGTVSAIACTELDGRPIAVTGSHDDSVRIWNLAHAEPISSPVTGHTDTVWSVACTELDDRPVAVTSSHDHTALVWDMATGLPLGPPLRGHERVVRAAACTVLDGRPVAVTGGDDATVRVWDIETGLPVGPPIGRPDLSVTATVIRSVKCTLLDGQVIAVIGSEHGVRVHNLSTRRPLGGLPLPRGSTGAWVLACTVLDGRPVVAAGTSSKVHVWDLMTQQPLGPAVGVDSVEALACTVLDGRPVVVTGDIEGQVQVWDVATLQPVGPPISAHRSRPNVAYGGWVRAVACTTLDGRPFAVTGASDQTVRVWDLTTRTCTGVLHLPDTPEAVAVAGDGTLICAFGDDIAFFTRELPLSPGEARGARQARQAP